jgi:hypothetical protein
MPLSARFSRLDRLLALRDRLRTLLTRRPARTPAPARLGLESLETRLVPDAPSVSGQVWYDANADGVWGRANSPRAAFG